MAQPNNLPGGSTWRPTVAVQGKLYHNVGALNPADGVDRRWAQLYVHDPSFDADAETVARIGSLRLGTSVSAAERTSTSALLEALQYMLHDSNAYVQDFISAGELFEQEPTTQALLILSRDARPADTHARQYDPGMRMPLPSRGKIPTCVGVVTGTTGGRGRPRTFAEVTVLMLEGQLEKGCVQLRRRDGPTHRIDFNHRSFDPLHFVLLFPCGDDGWHWRMPRTMGHANDEGLLAIHGYTSFPR